MQRSNAVRFVLVALVAALAGWGGLASEQAVAQPTTENVQMDNACYVKLPDLPAPRYGGFGAYNEETGVLTYAGGAVKLSEENTEAHEDLYAIKLDGSMTSWARIPYSGGAGYTSDAPDKGCREGSSVMISPDKHLSVFGKDGCDNGAFDTGDKKGGDIKELEVGETADRTGVRWRPNSGANGLPAKLEDEEGKLVRLMATWDTERDRVIFGQGTFDDAFDRDSQTEMYYATRSGAKWNISEFRPDGTVPSRRFGTCGAYVHIEDADDPSKTVDGVIVLGGKVGGDAGPQLKEVWWFDLSKNANRGEWVDISSRFENLDALGARREGACAYDAETMNFYSVMGRASSSIPDGASRSAGLWRTNLANLGDPAAPLTWERLAKDKQDDAVLFGRRLIPNVWDSVNKRFFVIAGRNDNVPLATLSDVWAIYPDVTGADCANLDPYAPFAEPSTPVPTSVPPTTAPTAGPVSPTSPPVPTTPPPPPDPEAQACPGLDLHVPASVIAAALGSPDSISGWKELCNPSLPRSIWNTPRQNLGLRNPGAPYNPLYNGVVYKCGCN